MSVHKSWIEQIKSLVSFDFNHTLAWTNMNVITDGTLQHFCIKFSYHVSLLFPPAKEGYAVYKSVPYGSVDDTLPYLVRRAQENRTVLQGIRKERDLLRQELYRRVRLRGGS